MDAKTKLIFRHDPLSGIPVNLEAIQDLNADHGNCFEIEGDVDNLVISVTNCLNTVQEHAIAGLEMMGFEAQT